MFSIWESILIYPAPVLPSFLYDPADLWSLPWLCHALPDASFVEDCIQRVRDEVPSYWGGMWVISSHIWVASSQGFLNCMENFLQVPCNYVDLCWLQKARGSASYVVQTLSRSSVKGHKSSIKEGNALYLDGLQYSNKAGWLGPWMGSAMSSWHVAFRVEVHLRRLESSRSWFRITWRKKASGSLRSGLRSAHLAGGFWGPKGWRLVPSTYWTELPPARAFKVKEIRLQDWECRAHHSSRRPKSSVSDCCSKYIPQNIISTSSKIGYSTVTP